MKLCLRFCLFMFLLFFIIKDVYALAPGLGLEPGSATMRALIVTMTERMNARLKARGPLASCMSYFPQQERTSYLVESCLQRETSEKERFFSKSHSVEDLVQNLDAMNGPIVKFCIESLKKIMEEDEDSIPHIKEEYFKKLSEYYENNDLIYSGIQLGFIEDIEDQFIKILKDETVEYSIIEKVLGSLFFISHLVSEKEREIFVFLAELKKTTREEALRERIKEEEEYMESRRKRAPLFTNPISLGKLGQDAFLLSAKKKAVAPPIEEPINGFSPVFVAELQANNITVQYGEPTQTAIANNHWTSETQGIISLAFSTSTIVPNIREMVVQYEFIQLMQKKNNLKYKQLSGLQASVFVEEQTIKLFVLGYSQAQINEFIGALEVYADLTDTTKRAEFERFRRVMQLCNNNRAALNGTEQDWVQDQLVAAKISGTETFNDDVAYLVNA